jgi:HSP20 family protein
MTPNDWKTGWQNVLENMAEGWRRLWNSAGSALTRFKPGKRTNLPEAREIDDDAFLSEECWSMLGSDVFEDERRVVVRLEVPGLQKDDFDIEVSNDSLTVRGEKRFERESTEGRWHVLQCAYGSFQRSFALPAKVRADEAQARYQNGVLRIELPKASPGAPAKIRVRVE